MLQPAALAAVVVLLTGLSSSCAATIDAPAHELNAEALAQIEMDFTIHLAPPELFSTRYNQHDSVLRSVRRAMKEHLQKHGYTVLSTARFREVWKESETRLGGLYDPRTGELAEPKMERCLSETIQKLSREASFSGVMLPVIDYKNVDLEPPYREATWEGVRRRMQFDDGLTNTRWTKVLTMTTGGEVAFVGAGGLDFAQKTVRAEDSTILLEAKLPEDFSPEAIQECVALALGPLLSAQGYAAPVTSVQ